MFHYKVPKGRALTESAQLFRQDFCAWITHCASTHDPRLPGRMREQAVLPATWLPLLPYCRDKAGLRAWMLCFRDACRDHFTQRGQWRHGYWREGEGGDGTAHFRIFLDALWRCCPDDGGTAQQFLDAAEHLGNWVAEVPAWFDWKHGLFRVPQPGTAASRADTGPAVNVPAHLHYLAMALSAYEMGGGQRYLELAARQGRLWARAVIAGLELPLALGPDGPIYNRLDFARLQSPANRAMVPSRRRSAPGARARELLARGAVDIFLKMWQHLREPLFKAAAETILDSMGDQLEDADAGIVVAAIRHYRNFTGDTRYDAPILDTAANLYPYRIDVLGVAPGRASGAAYPQGVSMGPLQWLENGKSRQHSPILLALAAEISGNERMATRALELARGYFLLARRFLPDGWAHGQSGRCVAAVCRGEARDNGTGMVTEVLLPLVSVFEIQG